MGVALGLTLAACGGGGGGGSGASQQSTVQDQKPVQTTAPAPAPTQFTDVTTTTGIDYSVGYRNYYSVGYGSSSYFAGLDEVLAHMAIGGAAAGDYDADGDIDVFITPGDIGPNLLYRNSGLGVFTEVAAAAGLAFTATSTESYRHSSPAFADMNGDGHLDLFIGGMFGDPSLIYRNNGDGTFSNVTPGSGIDTLEAKHNISAAFGDYDLDGDLDLFVTHWGTQRNLLDVGDTEHLWRNDTSGGTITFSSVSVEAGISPSILTLPDPEKVHPDHDWTFTPTFARINDDLYPDLLIVADFNRTQLFINNRDGTFSNQTDVFVLTDQNGMGSAVGDYDNDGDLDWFVTAIYEPNHLLWHGNHFYQNEGGVFVKRTDELGVRDGGWGWGTCFMDFENDGDLDIYLTNGYDLEGEYHFDRSRAYVSSGGNFLDRAQTLGLDDTYQGRGVVCADFDNDGDVDILQLHLGSSFDSAATMWRNDTSGNNYLRVKLNGYAQNTEAAGARIYVTVGSVTQMHEIMIGNNYISQNPTIQVFGLGTASQADQVRVEWPDGTETIQSAVNAGQTMIIEYSAP